MCVPAVLVNVRAVYMGRPSIHRLQGHLWIGRFRAPASIDYETICGYGGCSRLGNELVKRLHDHVWMWQTYPTPCGGRGEGMKDELVHTLQDKPWI